MGNPPYNLGGIKSWKGDKVSKVVMSATYDTVDDAKEDEEYHKDYYTSDGMKVSRKGKKLSLTLTGSAVENYDGTKSELKEELEEDGYKCK